jgi:hypothetical protein
MGAEEITKVSREGLPASAVSDLERRLEKLNRRARKLGVAELILNVTPPRTETRTTETGDSVTVQVVDVEVLGETPKLDGWELVAVIEHDDENLTRPVPGVEADIRRYRNAPPHCDHCGTTRRRLETFLVRKAEVISQVGRDCLADFLGGQRPEAVLWLAGWVREVDEMLGESWGYAKEDYRAEAEPFLAKVAALIRVDGWMSRTKAREWNKVATADDAWLLTFPPKTRDAKLVKWMAGRQVTPEDEAVAKAALAWARELDPDDPNEYRSNLGRVARKEAWSNRHVGLAASAVSSHLREIEREVAFRKASEGFRKEWVGTPGERLRGLDLELVSARSFEGDYGPRTLVIFVDAERRRFKWWASGSKYQNVEAGHKVHVDATVKKHEEWKGLYETVVNRVKEV